MAYKTRTSSVIDDAKQIDALATSIRFEIVSALEAMDDAATVAELADALGRPADGLYYHLRALVRAGVLHERTDAGVRRYRSTVPAGQRSRLGYKPGATKNAKAVERTATSMSRLSQRDFANAIARSDSVVAGPLRELWAARVRAWVGDEELTELNRLLNEIVQLLHRPRSKDADKLIALHWIVAPIDAKPARRANAATKKRPPRSN